MLITAFLSFAVSALPQEESPSLRGPITAFRVDHINTLDGDPINGGVIVVRDGMIEKLGAAVVVPEAATVIDLRGTGSTVTPPFVIGVSSMLQSDSRGRGNNAKYCASDSLWLAEDSWDNLLENGVLIMGVDPPGSGAPGRTSVLDVNHGWPKATPMVRDLHLKLTIDASFSAKDLLRGGFKGAEDAIEKEDKAKSDWEKARKEWEERQKKREEEAKKEKDGDQPQQSKSEEKKKKEEDPEPPKEFKAPEISANVQPFIDLINKERIAQVHINTPAEWLHWEDVLGEREIIWEAVLDYSTYTNLHEVIDRIADSGVRVFADTRISYLPNTRIKINLAQELVEAGVENLCLLPAYDTPRGVEQWRVRLADVVREGMDSKLALRAATLNPAVALGQEEVVQALTAGSPANFVIFGGDPLESASQATHVVYEGAIVYDREKEDSK